MVVLTMRTEKPEAEIGLYDDTGQQLAYHSWEAHRQLSDTIHNELQELLDTHHKAWQDLTGIVCYKGPGSFTGLRIGFAVANALAYGLDIPIVASAGASWQAAGLQALQAGKNEVISMPEYGALANISQPRK